MEQDEDDDEDLVPDLIDLSRREESSKLSKRLKTGKDEANSKV
jgi:hypothetical protein